MESLYCRESRNDAEEGRSKGNGNERGRERQKNKQEMREMARQSNGRESFILIQSVRK